MGSFISQNRVNTLKVGHTAAMSDEMAKFLLKKCLSCFDWHCGLVVNLNYSL